MFSSKILQGVLALATNNPREYNAIVVVAQRQVIWYTHGHLFDCFFIGPTAIKEKINFTRSGTIPVK